MTRPLDVCAFCHNTGKNGAQFILCVGAAEHRVHKPCGETLAKSAPEGTEVRLVHWSVRRNERRAQREQTDQELVQSFWADKFAAAERRKGKQNGAQAPL